MTDKPVPTITIRVVNREDFLVETNIADVPFPDYALNMLETALRGVKAAKQDQEAIDFQQKMQAAANVARAMQKRPGLQ
jgi:hypothetical protein